MSKDRDSFSAGLTFQRCPQKYYYRYIEELVPKTQTEALFEGVRAHEMMSTFFKAIQASYDKATAKMKVLKLVEEMLEDGTKFLFEDEETTARELTEEAWAIVERYIDKYWEDWEVLHVEETIEISTDKGRLSCTPDLIVADSMDNVWVVDHKTTSSLPEDGLPFGDLQCHLYLFVVKALYPETAGFIFNRLRKKVPTQPRLAKTGKKRVAYLNTMDTDYETLRNFLKKEAPDLLDDEDHKRRLAELMDQGDRFFWQDTVFWNEPVVAQTLKDFFDTKELMRYKRYPRHLSENYGYLSCSRCPYERVCKADMYNPDNNARKEFYEYDE